MKTVLIIDEIHDRFLKKFINTLSNDFTIACLSKTYEHNNMHDEYNLITPFDYLSDDLDSLIINEAALASSKWADSIQDMNLDSMFKNKRLFISKDWTKSTHPK